MMQADPVLDEPRILVLIGAAWMPSAVRAADMIEKVLPS